MLDPLLTTLPKFHTRPAEFLESDTAFIISAFDSAVTFLNPINSGAQWGAEPFTSREGWVDKTRDQIRHSIRGTLDPGKSSLLRVFIVERECTPSDVSSMVSEPPNFRTVEDGRRLLPTGLAFIREDYVPDYVDKQEQLDFPEADRRSNVYLELLVSDHRLKGLERGSGTELIKGIKEYGRERGKKRMYLDSWGGSERKLIRYYEKQGFQAVGDFTLPREKNGPWLGWSVEDPDAVFVRNDQSFVR